MGLKVALFVALTLVGCGGSVDDEAGGAVGDVSAGAASLAGGGASFAEAGGASVTPAGGRAPVPPDAMSDAGNDGDAAGGKLGGGLAPSLIGTGGVGGSKVKRTVVDAPAKPRGFLSGLQYRADANGPSVFTIDAIFETTRGQWDGCTKVQLGQCWYYDCPPGSAAYLPSVPLQDAGAVTVITASEPPTTVGVGLLYDYWYESNATGELWPTSGRKLTFAATGGTVPAFNLDVQSPPTVVLTSLNGEAAPTDLNRTEGAALRWMSSGSGIAYFSLYGFYERTFAAVCEFDAGAHAGMLPAQLLQALEPGPAYHVVFRGTSRAHATVEGWELDASLVGYGGPTQPYDQPLVALH